MLIKVYGFMPKIQKQFLLYGTFLEKNNSQLGG